MVGLFSCTYQVQLVSFENEMVVFSQDRCVMSILGMPLRGLLLKRGPEELVGTVEPLKNEILQFASLNV